MVYVKANFEDLWVNKVSVRFLPKLDLKTKKKLGRIVYRFGINGLRTGSLKKRLCVLRLKNSRGKKKKLQKGGPKNFWGHTHTHAHTHTHTHTHKHTHTHTHTHNHTQTHRHTPHTHTLTQTHT